MLGPVIQTPTFSFWIQTFEIVESLKPPLNAVTSVSLSSRTSTLPNMDRFETSTLRAGRVLLPVELDVAAGQHGVPLARAEHLHVVHVQRGADRVGALRQVDALAGRRGGVDGVLQRGGDVGGAGVVDVVRGLGDVDVAAGRLRRSARATCSKSAVLMTYQGASSPASTCSLTTVPAGSVAANW